jgi:hypothetical protein
MKNKQSRLVGSILWSEARPFFYGIYTGITIDGEKCKIDYDYKVKAYTKSGQIGTDKILCWHFRVKHFEAMYNELDLPS